MSTNSMCHQVDQHSDEVLSTLTFTPIKYDATVISCPVLSCPVLSYLVLSFLVHSCLVLFYAARCIMSSLVLSYSVLFVLSCHVSYLQPLSRFCTTTCLHRGCHLCYSDIVYYIYCFFNNFYDFTFISYPNMCGNLKFSRAARLSLKIGGEELALVPYADLMNHNPYR